VTTFYEAIILGPQKGKGGKKKDQLTKSREGDKRKNILF